METLDFTSVETVVREQSYKAVLVGDDLVAYKMMIKTKSKVLSELVGQGAEPTKRNKNSSSNVQGVCSLAEYKAAVVKGVQPNASKLYLPMTHKQVALYKRFGFAQTMSEHSNFHIREMGQDGEWESTQIKVYQLFLDASLVQVKDVYELQSKAYDIVEMARFMTSDIQFFEFDRSSDKLFHLDGRELNQPVYFDKFSSVCVSAARYDLHKVQAYIEQCSALIPYFTRATDSRLTRINGKQVLIQDRPLYNEGSPDGDDSVIQFIATFTDAEFEELVKLASEQKYDIYGSRAESRRLAYLLNNPAFMDAKIQR